MKFLVAFYRRLPWLNVSVGLLLVLLQRTPAVRVLLQAKDYVLAAGPGELLRAAFTAAALGATHSLAGATTYIQSPANPIQGTVGTPLSGAFSFTGAPSDAQNWTILSGSLPPGISFIPGALGNTIRARDVGFSGTPTQAGNFSVTVMANGLAGQSPPVTLIFQIGGGATVAPTITAQPQSQTVNAGANVTFSVQASGSPPPGYQWSKDGQSIGGATSATLSLTNVQASDAGTYAVVASNSAGNVTSSFATLTVNTPGGTAPEITSQPLSVTAAAGSTAALMVVATGTNNTYQWRRGNEAISGATQATLLLPNVSAAQAGSYTVAVTGGGQTVTSSPATLSVATGEARLANLSVRTNLGTSQALIVGFAMNGAKNVLLRGIGPTLASFGVSGAYGDPRLAMFEGTTQVAENDNWNPALASAFSAVGAFALTAGSRDAALQTQITGSRTAQVSGPNSGVVLVEVYDSGAGNAVRLVNVSARNFVGTGDNILIAGFVVNASDGATGKTLLIRAVGPTLAGFGVGGTLNDPKLEIFDGNRKIVENDNWSAAVGSVFSSVGAFELTANSRDAALIVTLPPGSGYTAQVSGIGGGTGEALVEVYEVP